MFSKRNYQEKKTKTTKETISNQTNPPKKKTDMVTVVLVCILVVGLGIMLYPRFSDFYNRLHQSFAVVDYNRTVDQNTKKKNRELWEAAEAYNRMVAQRGIRFKLTGEEKAAYEKVLNVTDTGIMGYINAPKVNIRLPIYHDTTDSVLQIAVGHLAGTSLPVGGPNSHSVLTGHTGLPSAKLFTDIDKFKKGDTFQIVVLDHVLTYSVDDIRTVLPNQVQSLKIEPGRDLCTLVTCTPYGINTHRLLVTGHRIPTPKHTRPSKDWWKERLLTILKAVLPIAGAAAAVGGYVYYRKKKKLKITKGA